MLAGMLEILHPTDLTADSEVAFAHALRIVMAKDSRLTALHVQEPDVSTDWNLLGTVQTMLRRWGYLEEGSTLDDVNELGIALDKVETEGFNRLRTILKYLHAHPVDLIVLATTGRKGFDAWFEGSIAESVARVSKVMSLFVPHGCRGFVDIETGKVSLTNILVPVVRSPAPNAALAAARTLADELGVPDARIRACFVGHADDAPLIDADEIPLFVRSGPVAETLCGVAEEIDADLVVMATEGHNGILDALRGSTSEQVLRSSKRPLLAVPAASGD